MTRQEALWDGIAVMLSTLRPAQVACVTCGWVMCPHTCRKCDGPLCDECHTDRHGYCAACGVAEFVEDR